MASTRAALAAYLLSRFITPAYAGSFLGASQTSMKEADRSLEHELSDTVDRERLQHLKDALRPTFTALPKNDRGHLEHQTVRYILHRFFVQEHGWSVKGLEPDGDVWRSASTQEHLKTWVPSYLHGRLEQRVGSRGVDLTDLAALAAALEDLIHQEAATEMRRVFELRGYPETGLTKVQVEYAVASYMADFLSDNNTIGNVTAENIAQKTRKFFDRYTDGAATKTWLRNLTNSHLDGVSGGADFSTAAGIAADIGTRFSTLNDKECRGIKKLLMTLQAQSNKAGRVRLSDFYRQGLQSHWAFTEKVDYLRVLGALDESDKGNLMVIIPNYIGAQPNCMDAASLYDVCCRNECEDLVSDLERKIAAPSALPAHIAKLVAEISSDTIKAPRTLSAELLDRLNKMASLHGGEVKLHGRLFAQWMHHAFPNECPFPHTAATASPVTPDEWIGQDTLASEEERRRHITTGDAADSSSELPWHHVEETLSSSHVSMHDAEKSLESELQDNVSKERLQEFKRTLQATYVALPKNDHGHLEHQTVRYALHRLFVQRHGWFIKGLEPNGDVWHTSTSTEALKDWVPSYMLDRLEEKVRDKGVDLHDLAALAAAIEDLVQKEAVGRLEDVYIMLGFPTHGTLSLTQAKEAITFYTQIFLMDEEFTPKSLEEAKAQRDEWLVDNEDWRPAEMWLHSVFAEHLGEAMFRDVDFAAASNVVIDIGIRYSSFNDRECLDLKRSLVAEQNKSRMAGRVRLADFYKVGLHTHWQFTEKPDYLRALGALDQHGDDPMLIVPNYVESRPQCLNATNLYAVCCRNECEDLMGHLERQIAKPAATPHRIAELVAALPSDFVEAPRQLSKELRARLDSIAAQFGGEVNLHGRLFAQWMHHAYPNECPYPHVAGTSSPLSPDEWLGVERKASKEDRESRARGADVDLEDTVSFELPWSQTEELLGSKHLSTKSVEDSLEAELSGRVSKERISQFKEELHATYAALPKNSQGHLEHQTMRYVLHRLFVHRNGWYIRGLEPNGDVWHTRVTDESLKDWVPSYLLERLEKRVGTRGVDLNDLAALAAALEDLVNQEATGRVQEVVRTLGLPEQILSHQQATEVITTYMVMYLNMESNPSETFKANTPEGLRKDVTEWISEYENWTQAEAWMLSMDQMLLGAPSARVAVEDVSRAAVQMGTRYGEFNGKECRDLKHALVGSPGQESQTGRILLADFYKTGLVTHWELGEKVDYLRALGVLDESVPGSPMVIVPNYLTAQPNCLPATELYSVCCRNECEDLMGHLEINLAAPTAPPHRIAQLVSELGSDTVKVPRVLAPKILSRLEDIAAHHGGQVNIHGRLFAQWMHHAFPNECPFPHEAGTSSPMTPDEWISQDRVASEEERRKYAEGSSGERIPAVSDLPWSHAEELLGSAHSINAQDVDSRLEAELAGVVSQERLLEYKKALQTTYSALPKNSAGHLEHQAVRYVLHRLFVQQRGWFIKGLEPKGDVWHNQAAPDTLQEWVPSYLLSKLEERMGSRGIDLHDLAALAAALEDLVEQEALASVREVYQMWGLGVDANLSRQQAQDVVTTYTTMYLMEANYSESTPSTIASEQRDWTSEYEDWRTAETWLRGLEREQPKWADGADFAAVSQVAIKVGARYSAFNDRECKDLKRSLMSMKHRASVAGRVRLPDFYRIGLQGHWELGEKQDYLRALGAMDESNVSSPMVIIPNYLGARPNCLEATNLYDICCHNECEDLMASLEREIAASEAAPHQVAELVSKLASDTVVAPRQLPASMLERLNSMASHDGKVRLHGRLFAQWMHHAFPNECPFPHEAGTASPVTPDDWIGAELSASREERQKIVDADSCSADGEKEAAAELPWSDEDEESFAAPSRRSGEPREDDDMSLCVALVLAGISIYAMLASPLASWRRQLAVSAAKCGVSWQLLAVCWFSTIAFATKVVDSGLFAFVICAGVVSNYLNRGAASTKASKCEKSFV